MASRAQLCGFVVAVGIVAVASGQTTNLLQNGGFDGSLSGWTVSTANVPSRVTVSYSSNDAAGSAGSGSAAITYVGPSEPLNTYTGIREQVPVRGGSKYTLSAKIFSVAGSADVVLLWFSDAGQIGTLGETAKPIGQAENRWISSSADLIAPPNATSAIVTLMIAATPGASAYFDNVVLSEEASQCDFATSLQVDRTTAAIGDVASFSWCVPANLNVSGSVIAQEVARSATGPWTTQGQIVCPCVQNLAMRFSSAAWVGTNYFRLELQNPLGNYVSNTVSVNVTPGTIQFTATPSIISAGETSTLSWTTSGATSVTIDNGVGAVAASGIATVKPTTTTTYTLSALSSSGSTTTAQVTVKVIASSTLKITAMPTGMTAPANTPGGVDHVTVANIGGASTNVNVAANGGFFNVSPSSFVLAPGASQSVTITSTPQPAGVYEGSVQFIGNTNTVGAPVRFLSVGGTPSGGHLSTTTPRVDVSGAAGTTITGTMNFHNDSASIVQSIAVSNQPWLTPEAGIISIGAGQTRAVSFSIDPTKIPTEAVGTQTAVLSLTYLVSTASKRASAEDINTTSHASGSANYTPNVTLASAVVPPLGQEVAYVIPGGAFALPTYTSDFIGLNRAGSALSSASVFLIQGDVPPGTLSKVAPVGPIPGDAAFRYSDIAAQLFKAPQSGLIGTLLIRSSDIDNTAVAASFSHIATPPAPGAFIGAVKAIRSDRAIVPGGKTYLVGIRKADGVATSLYWQEIAGTSTTVKTDFLDVNGNVLATRTDSIAASSLTTSHDPAPSGAIAAVGTNMGGGTIVARALVTYGATGDITDVIDWNVYNGSTPTTFVVPYATRHNGTTTELDVMNTSTTTPLVATLEFRGPAITGKHRAVRPASSSVPQSTKTITVAPSQTLILNDVVGTLGVADASGGAILMTASSGTPAVAAFLNDTSTGVGPFSTALPVGPTPVTKGDRLEIAGIEDSAPQRVASKAPNTFSNTFGLVELAGAPATVDVTLYYDVVSGDLSAQTGHPTKTYTLQPGGVLSLDLRSEFFGTHAAEYGDLDFRVDFLVRDGSVMPYVVSTESASGDRLVRSGRF